MKELLKKEFEDYLKGLKKIPLNSIRCNTLKISPKELRKRLEKKGWLIEQPFKDYQEVMIIKNELIPGEIGRSLEHLLGYYYIQEIASMLPPLVLEPKEEERILDLCAAPGSKTTQIAAIMKNKGLLIANEVSFGRMKILAGNLERCGVMNCILTRRDAIALCNKFKQNNFYFDKILLDAPCSGEGTINTTPKTLTMWNINTINFLSNLQKSMISSAISILKENGILIYSTCTHAPEEDEEIIDFALKNFNMEIQEIKLPIKTKEGITRWKNKEYDPRVRLSKRVYPHISNTEGFFIAKLKKVKN
jgi:NOL1/NOP2/sun family putative RNA methylase